MKRLFAAAFIAMSTLAAAPAIAREAVPVVNHENIAVTTSSGKPVQGEQVKQAILAAAASKGWTLGYQADGKLLATYVKAAKHTVVVEVEYTADKYTLRYQDSTNMKAKQMDGQTIIHPYYNKWVQNFRDAIRAELLKL